ncbi:MAG: hypothetical protein C0594_07720, partial [Marinilabiliales bacterium]
MEMSKEKELLKRISELVKQNKSLQEQVRTLSDENEKLFLKNEKNKNLLAKLRVTDEDKKSSLEGASKHLKFKMATVLFADIQ